jgi:hypothetical protein
MINIFAERRSEVALSEDEHPVQKLGPCRFDPALGDGDRSGRSDRRLDDFDSVCSKDLVERGGELRVSVVDEEAKVGAAVGDAIETFLACWVTQASLGRAVQPAR